MDAFDRGAASERLVSTMKTQRRLVLVVVGLAIAAVVAMGVAVKWRFDSLERFREESRAVDADVKTLLRGARADAAILKGAFDEQEFADLLRSQGPYWEDRVRTCALLRDRARELEPRGAEQTRTALEIEHRLEDVSVNSTQLARAAETADLPAARAAATRLAAADLATPNKED